MPDDGAGAVIELINRANRELLLKQFKLQSELVMEALRRAKERGVEVRVMLNPHTSGGDRWNDEPFARLRDWGITTAWTSESFPVTHEKSMLIDGEAVLISTFNFADKYFNETRDYGVISRNRDVVTQVRAGFEADWRRTFFHPISALVWCGAAPTAGARWPA
jgi:cardiolipin synthase